MSDNQEPQKQTAKDILKKFKGRGLEMVVKTVTSISVEGVVAAAIVSLVPAETKTKKIKRMVGAHVIGSMVAGMGADWSWRQVREIIDAWPKNEEED